MADGFIMRVERLDLLRQVVYVEEAALDGVAGGDRVDDGGLVGPGGDRNSAGRGIGSSI